MEKPDFYRYIAVFSYSDEGINITFPDLPGCVSFGEDEGEAMRMAQEALTLHMWGMEDDDETIPEPSTIRALRRDIELEDSDTFCLIEAFMPAMRERMEKRFVKKTLSIPAWLNSEAERYKINFSQLLQRAIKQELNIA